MTIATRLLGRLAKLPPAITHAVTVERDLPVPMPDGAVLLADRYAPRGVVDAPIVLIRSPYGRSVQRGVRERVLAERGYQVVSQSCRGGFGSGGELRPFAQERADGHATLEWLAAQPWFTGKVATFGDSYLGWTQWALAPDAPDFLAAIAPQVVTARIRDGLYPCGVFAFEDFLTWSWITRNQERMHHLLMLLRQQKRVAPGLDRVPIGAADAAVCEGPVPFYREWVAHERADDPYWADEDVDRRAAAGRIAAAPLLIGGWYDAFLPGQLADYQALVEAGRRPYLTVGPWTHSEKGLRRTALRESLAWYDAHLRGDRSRVRAEPVRIYVMGGAQRWIDLPSWPPPATSERWHLLPAGALAPAAPAAEAAPSSYRYDPADPTPALAGTSVFGPGPGEDDNRELEQRADVLTFTSAPLTADLEAIGPVRAEIHLRSSAASADVFVRLCDVDPKGRSTNVCDGLARVAIDDPEGVVEVPVELWPTAYRFAAGHRVRAIVASGAHPRWGRNPGTGEPQATATTLRAADQQVFHDAARPSAIVLPVVR